MKAPDFWFTDPLLQRPTLTNFPLKRAVKSGWDEMSDRYLRGAVISTDDVHYGPLIPGEKEFRLLGDVRGKRLLELACGGAQNAIALAKWGARVTAVDLSSHQLAHARYLARSAGASITEIDLVLSHDIGGQVTKAYVRSDLYERRRPLMAAWGDYILPAQAA